MSTKEKLLVLTGGFPRLSRYGLRFTVLLVLENNEEIGSEC